MLTLVIVNYRSAALAIEAIRTARLTTKRPLEIIVVDNTESPGEAELLRPHADRLLSPFHNPGYGAAINLAAIEARGEVIIVSNPDVVFDVDSLDLLCDEVETGAGVAGPAFFWDTAFTWRMPPAEVHTAITKLDESVATRLAWWQKRSDRRRLAARIAFWRQTGSHDAESLSGAVLAFPAELLRRERFDERYFLYFEETDLLRRLSRAGHQIRHVPQARCRHLFNQSAGGNPLASGTYARSEAAYHAKWSPRPMRWLAEAIARPAAIPVVRSGSLTADRDGMLAEVSPSPDFAAAAGAFVRPGPVTVPAEILASLRQMNLFLRLVDPATLQASDAVRWSDRDAGVKLTGDVVPF